MAVCLKKVMQFYRWSMITPISDLIQFVSHGLPLIFLCGKDLLYLESQDFIYAQDNVQECVHECQLWTFNANHAWIQLNRFLLHRMNLARNHSGWGCKQRITWQIQPTWLLDFICSIPMELLCTISWISHGPSFDFCHVIYFGVMTHL